MNWFRRNAYNKVQNRFCRRFDWQQSAWVTYVMPMVGGGWGLLTLWQSGRPQAMLLKLKQSKMV